MNLREIPPRDIRRRHTVLVEGVPVHFVWAQAESYVATYLGLFSFEADEASDWQICCRVAAPAPGAPLWEATDILAQKSAITHRKPPIGPPGPLTATLETAERVMARRLLHQRLKEVGRLLNPPAANEGVLHWVGPTPLEKLG